MRIFNTLRTYNPFTYIFKKLVIFLKRIFPRQTPATQELNVNPTNNRMGRSLSLRDFLNKYSDTLVGFGMINLVYKIRDHLDPGIQYKLLKEIKNYLDLGTPLWMDFLDEEYYTELERLNHARKHVSETLDNYISQIPKIHQTFGKKITPLYPFRLESLLGKTLADFPTLPEDNKGTLRDFLRVHRILVQYNEFLNGIESYRDDREGLLMQLQEYQEYLSYLDNAHEIPKSCRAFFNNIIKKVQRNVNLVKGDLAKPDVFFQHEKKKLLAKTLEQEKQIARLKTQLEQTQKQLETQGVPDENALNKWDDAFTLELVTRHLQLKSFLKERPGKTKLKSYLTALQEELIIPANYSISAELKCRQAMFVLQKHIRELWLLVNLGKGDFAEDSIGEGNTLNENPPLVAEKNSPQDMSILKKSSSTSLEGFTTAVSATTVSPALDVPNAPRLPASTSSENNIPVSQNNTEVSTLTSPYF